MYRLINCYWRLTLILDRLTEACGPSLLLLWSCKLHSGISVYSVYICILQQCCMIVIIYDAPSRIFYFFLFRNLHGPDPYIYEKKK